MLSPPRLSAFSRSSAVAPKAGSFSMMSRTYWQKYADPPAVAQPVVAGVITGVIGSIAAATY